MGTPTVDYILGLSSLKAYWPLSTLGGADPTDELIGGLDQTFFNTPTTGIDMGFAAGDTGVQFASASSQYARRSHNAAFNFGTGDGSIAFWAIIPSSDATVRYFIAHDGDGEGGSWDLKHVNSLFQSRFAGQTPGNSSFTPNSSVKFVVWNFDRDGNAVRYIDGSSVHSASIASASGVDVSVNNDLFFARRFNAGTPGYANVTLAHVVFRGALWTPTEMSDAMAARLLSGDSSAPAGHSPSTGAARTPSPSVGARVEHASALALAPSSYDTGTINAQAGIATAEVWVTRAEGAELDVEAPAATATAEALGTAGLSVPAGHATATAATHGAAHEVGVPAGIASPNASVVAHDPTADPVDAPSIAATATATGAASAAAPALGVAHEHPAATGAAGGVGATVMVSPSAASATGSSQSPGRAVATHAAVTEAAVAAQTPSPSVRANAGHASASASAEAVAIALAMHPAIASAIAEAYPDQVAIATRAVLAVATGTVPDIRPPFDWGGVRVYLNPAPSPSAVIGPAPSPSAVMGDA